METHNFMLILDGQIDEATSDLLFEAGLDDAAITAFDGHPALDADREAPTLLDAITSAVTQAESVADIHVVRVEGEELVSQADIAERTGRSRQAVNHWINATPTPPGSPLPPTAPRPDRRCGVGPTCKPGSNPMTEPTIAAVSSPSSTQHSSPATTSTTTTNAGSYGRCWRRAEVTALEGEPIGGFDATTTQR